LLSHLPHNKYHPTSETAKMQYVNEVLNAKASTSFPQTPPSRTWGGFFYDILNPGYWLGTKTGSTPIIDFNVNEPSFVTPVKSTRTWGSFVYNIITLKFLWS